MFLTIYTKYYLSSFLLFLAGLLEMVIEHTKTMHAKLCLQFLEQHTRKKSSGDVNELTDCLKFLQNLMYNSPSSKVAYNYMTYNYSPRTIWTYTKFLAFYLPIIKIFMFQNVCVKSGVVPLLHNIWSLCSVNKPLLRATLRVLIVLTAHCSEGMSRLSNVTRLLQGCHTVVTTLLMAVNVLHACMTYVCRSALGEISHYNMVSQCNYFRVHLHEIRQNILINNIAMWG